MAGRTLTMDCRIWRADSAEDARSSKLRVTVRSSSWSPRWQCASVASRQRRSAEGIAVGLKAAAEVYVEKAEVAWTVGAAGQPPRHGSRELRTCDWSREGDALHAELDIPIRQGDSTATSFILIGGRCVDRVTVPLAEAGSNVRIRAHSTVDPGLQRFREHLLPERLEKAREFETAVGHNGRVESLPTAR